MGILKMFSDMETLFKIWIYGTLGFYYIMKKLFYSNPV